MTDVCGVRIGDHADFQKTVTAEDILKFAEVTGDTNPLHSDPEYASKTRFRECIAHGMLSAGYISAVLGTKLAPQACAIYLSQSLRFMRPVKVGDTIRATVEVKGVEPEKRTLTLETECFNQNDELVTKGEAVIMLDPVNA